MLSPFLRFQREDDEPDSNGNGGLKTQVHLYGLGDDADDDNVSNGDDDEPDVNDGLTTWIHL